MIVWVVYDRLGWEFDSIWSTRELAEANAQPWHIIVEYEIDKGFK